MRSDSPRAGLIGGILLMLLGWIAYSGSFDVPFQFDDIEGIETNPTIRHLSLAALRPPVDGTGVAGRPVVNLSLAVNYALGGTNPKGYHLFNVVLHGLSSLVLFGLVRHTLLLHRGRLTPQVAWLSAWLAAGLWLVHPEQTESVICVIQRTELLVGFFYLLTLYGFVRSVGPSSSRAWVGVSLGACVLGMASKEVMVTAPLMVLLYDRTFVAGNFRAAWRSRRSLYLGLAATWILLGAFLLRSGGSRGTAAGFGLGVTPLEYAIKQCEAIWIYVRLTVWPHPLVVDYGSSLRVDPVWVWPEFLFLAALGAATIYGLIRRPVLGFIGAWFFAILAPSSSFVPLLTQTVAEHRMYLPLAAIVTAATVGASVRLGARLGTAVAGGALLAAFCVLTRVRHLDYQSGIGLWQDTVAKRPGNSRAWHNLGTELSKDPGRAAQAVVSFREALRLDQHSADAHYGLALMLAKTSSNNADEIIAHYAAAIRDAPGHVEAHLNLADILGQQPGRLLEAIALYYQAIQLDDENPRAHNNLAAALSQLPDRTAEAISHYEKALSLKPNDAETHYNFANTLGRSPGGLSEALKHYAQAIALRPDFPLAHYNLANELAKIPGRIPEAVAHYESALRGHPDFGEAHFNLAIAFANTGRIHEAIRHFEIVLQLNPGSDAARRNLAQLQAAQK